MHALKLTVDLNEYGMIPPETYLATAQHIAFAGMSCSVCQEFYKSLSCDLQCFVSFLQQLRLEAFVTLYLLKVRSVAAAAGKLFCL